ncbi:MAG TPA: response regulator, partial [Opitutales bacterium]|nr:response regulator [Opitutales bacterium]
NNLFNGKRIGLLANHELIQDSIQSFARYWGLVVDIYAPNRDMKEPHEWVTQPTPMGACLIELKGPKDSLPPIHVPALHNLVDVLKQTQIARIDMIPVNRKKMKSASMSGAQTLTIPIKFAALYESLLVGFGGPEHAQAATISHVGFDQKLAQTAPLKILLTEDNAVNQKVALLTLKKLGYKADLANNGQEALDALEKTPYDLILMDVQMPVMDGLEATRLIRKRHNDAQRPWIVALTAGATEGDRNQTQASGMDDHLNKPFRVNELQDALQRCCDARKAITLPALN